MEKLRPSQVFVFGTAGDAFSSGFYLAGYGIFLWQYLSANSSVEFSPLDAAAVLAFKFLFEFAFDFLSSFFADINPRFSRRAVFLSGLGCQIAAFFGLMLATGLVSLNDFGGPGILNALIFVEFFRSAGNALISGTFEGWAVSLEELEATRLSNKQFQKSKMFTLEQVFERAGLFVGAAITVALLLASHYLDFPRIPKIVWLLIWGFAGFAQLIVLILVSLMSKGYPDIRDVLAGSSSSPPRFGDVLRAAFDSKSINAWVIYSALYVSLIVPAYAWAEMVKIVIPVDADQFMAYPAVLVLLTAGMAGALRARVMANHKGDLAGERVGRKYAVLFAVSLLFAGLLLLAYKSEPLGIAGIWSLTVIIPALAAWVLSRYCYSIAAPFASTILHANIGNDERMRAAVVSVRKSFANLLTSLTFFLVWMTSGTVSTPKALVVVVTGTALTMLAALWTPHHSRAKPSIQGIQPDNV